MQTIVLTLRDIAGWKIGQKTKSMRAKKLNQIIVDTTVLEAILLKTIEADAPINSVDDFLCVGPAGDFWEQTPAKVEAKYFMTEQENGWWFCEPKPEAKVEFLTITQELLEKSIPIECKQVIEDDNAADNRVQYYIQGTWGKTVAGVSGLQKLVVGDTIARQLTDYSDQWVVAQRIWDNTYSEVSA